MLQVVRAEQQVMKERRIRQYSPPTDPNWQDQWSLVRSPKWIRLKSFLFIIRVNHAYYIGGNNYYTYYGEPKAFANENSREGES